MTRRPAHIIRAANALESIQHRAEALAGQLEDLHVLAYDQPRGDNAGRGAPRQQWYLDELGQRRAKDALRHLERTVMRLDSDLGKLHAEVFGIVTEGEPADASLRGTLLGALDAQGALIPGSAKQELERAVAAQRRRAARGEYQPARVERQPTIGYRS